MTQVRHGLLYEATSLPADVRLVRRADNLVRSAKRRRLRIDERLHQLEHEPAVAPNQERQAEQLADRGDDEHARDEIVAHHQIRALRVRDLRLPPLQQLIMVLLEAPGGLLPQDLALSPRDGGRIPRGLRAAVPLIQAWADRAVDRCVRNPHAQRTVPLRAELAWVLRAHPEVESFESWPGRERRRAVNWIDQTLRRARLARAEKREHAERRADAARRAQARRTAARPTHPALDVHRQSQHVPERSQSGGTQRSLFPVRQRVQPSAADRTQPDGFEPQRKCASATRPRQNTRTVVRRRLARQER
jgi:hypothetical protein